MPDARIDWLVDAKHRPLLDLVHGLDRIVTLNGSSIPAWIDVVRRLRQVPYHAALDMQGLMKSAVLARASGARRVAGFSIWHLGRRPHGRSIRRRMISRTPEISGRRVM